MLKKYPEQLMNRDEKITSIKDPLVTHARGLRHAKGRLEQDKFLIEGPEILLWALDRGVCIDYILACESADREMLDRCNESGIRVSMASEAVLKKITETRYLIPVIGVGTVSPDILQQDFVIVMDGLRDFGNIGTIVRTAAAFGINDFLNTAENLDLFQKKTIEASRGTVFNARVKNFRSPGETIKHLREHGYHIIATTPCGDTIQSLTGAIDGKTALVIGGETHGACREIIEAADWRIRIPMHPDVESLNAGVAAGISIYELKLKQVMGMMEKIIKSTLGREINVAGTLLQRALDRELSRVSEFSGLQVVFLMVLKCDMTMTVEDMQKQFGIRDSETASFLASMEEKKLLLLTDSGRIEITEKGADILGNLWRVVENTEEKALLNFTGEEKSLLKKFIKRIQENCISITEE